MTRERGKTGTKSKPTFESVWAAIDRLVEAQKKVAEAQERAEEERRKAEEERRKAAEKAEEDRRKTEAARRETEASIKSLGEHVRELTEDLKEANGNFNNKWGEFMENLVMGDFPGVLKGRGIDARGVTPRMKYIVDRETKAEYDLVAHDGDTVVVAEVKTTLWREDVEEFLEKLARFKEHFPGYGDRRVLGAVAFLAVADETGKKRKNKKGRAAGKRRAAEKKKPADELAQKNGLFVIRSPGGAPGLAVVENPPDFEPREF